MNGCSTFKWETPPNEESKAVGPKGAMTRATLYHTVLEAEEQAMARIFVHM